MSDIIYTLGNDLYINLTNKCPCNCTFCIRQGHDGVGSAGSLWLEEDPTAQQVIDELVSEDLSKYSELVFCGYGEPFCALDTMLEVCRYVRSVSGITIRVNTNGLGDLINKKATAPLLKDSIDAVSVSLNAQNAEKYSDICKPEFGLESYDAMLKFAADCTNYVPGVKFSIVDVGSPKDIAECRTVADSLGIPLRVRKFN